MDCNGDKKDQPGVKLPKLPELLGRQDQIDVVNSPCNRQGVADHHESCFHGRALGIEQPLYAKNFERIISSGSIPDEEPEQTVES